MLLALAKLASDTMMTLLPSPAVWNIGRDSVEVDLQLASFLFSIASFNGHDFSLLPLAQTIP